MLRSFIDPLISIVYPQQCRACGGDVGSVNDGVACGTCWAETKLFTPDDPLCGRCGAVLTEKIEVCSNCVDARFDAAIALGVYEGALAATVVQLKKVPHLPARIASLMATRLASANALAEAVIVPIPLSKRRMIERGFNQANIIAQRVSLITGRPVFAHCLIRQSHTPMHRIAMDKKAREATVKNAFAVRAPKLITDRNVVLVDDVLTSGSTASACAHELKKHGAGKVMVLTLARAIVYS